MRGFEVLVKPYQWLTDASVYYYIQEELCWIQHEAYYMHDGLTMVY